MPKYRAQRIEARIYRKKKKKGGHVLYGDFRDYAHVGGKQEALKPRGSRWATEDLEVAKAVAEARLRKLQELDALTSAHSPDLRQLGALAPLYLEARADEEDPSSEQWLSALQLHLERAIEFFGAGIDLAALTPSRVKAYGAWLRSPEHNKGEGFADGSVHQHYCTMSSLYTWAQREEIVPAGINRIDAARRGANGKLAPVRYRLTEWFEIDEVAWLLRWLRDEYKVSRSDAVSFLYEMVAVAFFTGARRKEIFLLEVGDIDFDRQQVRLGNYKVRKTGSVGDLRYVPLFGQLREILWAYLHGPQAPQGRLLFPGPEGKRLDNVKRQRERIPLPVRLGDHTDPRNLHRDGKIQFFTWTQCRHSYCAARLQTLDQGAPVAKYTVQKEMGHGSSKMIDRVYGHLGRIRHRGEEVEYR